MSETTDPTTMDTTTTTSPEELQKKLDHLKASATQQYSLKNYSAAAEFFSEAAEVQDQINGEMSPENADLLYQYGRCLYHVGVSKSDVLGGKVAGGGEEPKRKKRKTAAPVAESSAAGAAKGEDVSDALKDGEEKLAEDVVGAAVEEKEGGKAEEKEAMNKPFFQITGDENWTDSEDEGEDDDENEDGEEEEDDDDFAIAYEILDVARVLLARKLASLEESSPEARQLKERLADTHDLQAEIKLENEQFADAVADAKETLKYKLELFPQESGMIAEAHYKLAIALDFASLPTAPAEEENSAESQPKEDKKEEPKVNEAMRAEAAEEMQKAITSCQLRIEKDQASLPSLPASKQENAKRTIADVKSMVAEMKNRLVDLRNPVPAAALTAGDPAGAFDGSDPLRGVLGAVLGGSKAEQAERLREVTSSANDLSGLVKKRKAKVEVEDGVEGKGKKAKVEEK